MATLPNLQTHRPPYMPNDHVNCFVNSSQPSRVHGCVLRATV